MASCVTTPSTTIGSQCCSQDDTPVITPRTHHTTTARSTLAVVSGVHRLQVGSACFSMPERSRSKISLQPHPTRCRVQPTLPPFVVIIVVSGLTNTACHCRRPCFSGRRKSCLEQSATRRHISFDSRCFPKAPQNISVLMFIQSLNLKFIQ